MWAPGGGEDSSSGGGTSEGPRLDLGAHEPIPDLPDEAGSSSGGGAAPTTSATSTGDEQATSTSGSSTSGEPGSTSTGEDSSSSGTSTGEPPPPPAVCGDKVCGAAERDPCYTGEGWCFGDCWKDEACKSACPCTPEAAAVKNFCAADPLPDCPATKPGGYCDPDGDGVTQDADLTRGFYEWFSTCG